MTTEIEKPTDRQLELLAQLCTGFSIAEAAGKLFIAERTGYNILAGARRKVGAGSNERLVVLALQEGWLEIDDHGVASVATGFQL